MSTLLLSFLLFVCLCHSFTNLNITEEIQDCCNQSYASECVISISANDTIEITRPIRLDSSCNTSITIQGSEDEETEIMIEDVFELIDYSSSLTFDNVILNGLFSDQAYFLKIESSTKLEINVLNSAIINFNTSFGVIYAIENINKWYLYNDTPDYISVDINDNNDFITFNFENSEFMDNINEENNGGVLSLIGHEFKVNINNCMFSNNRVEGWRKNGGCISWDRSSIPDILDYDSYSNQFDDPEFASDNDNGYNIKYTLNKTNIDFTLSSYINITHSIFEDNYGEDAGGVLYIQQIDELYDHTFDIVPNRSVTIHREFDLYSSFNYFENNQAGQYGGVYRHNGYHKDVSDISSITLKCDDSLYNIYIENDTFVNNRIPDNDDQTFAFGGCISSTCSKINIMNSLFMNNYAKYGAALTIYASSNTLIDSCKFINNEGYIGTSVYINGLLNDTIYNASIINSYFSGNKADNDGAAINAVVISKLYINNCKFLDNWNKYFGTISLNYFQGFNQMNVYITHSDFVNNEVDSDDLISGGAITALRYDYNSGIQLVCLSSSESESESDNNNTKTLTINIDSCLFTNNTQSAIGLYVTSAFISNSKFIGNSNSESSGGAIQSKYSWFAINNSTFSFNNAEDTGGAISTTIVSNMNTYSEWSLPKTSNGSLCLIRIDNSSFDNNFAQLGGAIFIGTSTDISNNIFINNNGDYGGAIALASISMNVFNNQFIDNSASAHGGALFQTQYTNEFVADNVMSINIAENLFSSCIAYSGGGFFLRIDSDENITIIDNTFSDNFAFDVGGGFVIGQLIRIDDTVATALEQSKYLNNFNNNTVGRSFNNYVSYPHKLYINSSSDYLVSPGISTTAKLGGYDIFGQDFESFMITDWIYREENLEFYWNTFTNDNNDDLSGFKLQTVNSGSLSSGQANITFNIGWGKQNDTINIILYTNYNDLISSISEIWQLQSCPSGYGYSYYDTINNTTLRTCSLCERETFNVNYGWNECLQCLRGLSCRGGEHIQILYKNWWKSSFSSSVETTFFCRFGECCTDQNGCDPHSEGRCPPDRDPDSIGCGKCGNNTNSISLSAVHGSNVCGDCTHLNDNELYFGVIIAFILYPICLVFLFGLSKYENNDGAIVVKNFYLTSIIQIIFILLIDYYQSLPSILTFSPDPFTSWLINIFFARIPGPIGDSGICLFNNMTIRDKYLWDMLLPSLILILSFIIFIIYQYIPQINKNQKYKYLILNKSHGYIFDPSRSFIFSLFFCIIPILWSCSHLFVCIKYGNENVFWNAPGQQCDIGIRVLVSLIFIFCVLLYLIINISYSYYIIAGSKQDDLRSYPYSIPLYLQRLQSFYFMVYPWSDDNNRRNPILNFNFNVFKLEKKKEWKYLYVGWISPFLRKLTCLIVHSSVIGEKGQYDQTFIITNLTLLTLVLYQLFSQDYTSVNNYTRYLYCIYLLYWLVLLIVSGSTKIISENLDTMPTLKITVNIIMYIPLCVAIITIFYAIYLSCSDLTKMERTSKANPNTIRLSKSKRKKKNIKFNTNTSNNNNNIDDNDVDDIDIDDDDDDNAKSPLKSDGNDTTTV